MVSRAPATHYHLKSEVSITLHYQLSSTRYTALRIKNCSKNTSTIKVATIKNTDEKPLCATAKSTPLRDTKEDTGKSMKNALYVLQYARRHVSG